MAIVRQNPIGIDAVDRIDSDNLSDDIKRLDLRISAADRARQGWLDEQYKFIKQREGIRRKKNIPWPGANNDNWPLTDAVIRRWKPQMAALVTKAVPVARFFGRNEQSVVNAKPAQYFYDWLFLNYMDDTLRTTFELVDLIALHGEGYTRQGWDFRTDQSSRILAVDTLFPNGIEAVVQQAQAEIQQLNAQGANQDIPTPFDIILLRLAAEYQVNPRDPKEQKKLARAAQGILDGKQFVRIVSQQTTCDKPTWQAVSPIDVLVPSASGDPEYADWVAINHRLSADEIRHMAKDGYFIPEVADRVAERVHDRGSPFQENASSDLHSLSSRQLTNVLDGHEGVDTEQDDQAPRTNVYEVYCRLDINGDNLTERCVLWLHRGTNEVLALYEYPHPFPEWPIVKFQFERKDKRTYSSRGIAKLLRSFQKLTNRQHNGRLDAQQIVLSPMLKVRNGSYDMTRNVRFRPGGRMRVQEVDDVQPFVHDLRVLDEFFKEENVTRGLAEQYIGVFDSSLTQMGGSGRERRTATEVDAVVSQISSVSESDAELFQISMAKVHRQLWDLWEDFGPPQIFARITDEEQPKMVTKAEISGDFDIVPAGKPTNTNRALMLNRAREMIQLLLQDPTGVVKKEELVKHYIEVMDPHLAKVLVREGAELEQWVEMMQEIAKAAEENGVKA